MEPKTNVEKLMGLGILGIVRVAHGAEANNDTSLDDSINNLSPKELVGLYCQWHLGDSGWWNNMFYLYNELINNASTQGIGVRTNNMSDQ